MFFNELKLAAVFIHGNPGISNKSIIRLTWR
jgi:hypothetical protein